MGKGFFNALKAESKEAAFRVAGTQVMKATKGGLLKILRTRGINNKQVEAVSDFLDTELGTALLSTIAGMTFTYLPKFKNDKRAQSIAKEFRVGGMALAGNLLATKAIADLLPVIGNIVESLPSMSIISKRIDTNKTLAPMEEQQQPTKIRVSDTSEPAQHNEELELEQLYSKEHYRLDAWH